MEFQSHIFTLFIESIQQNKYVLRKELAGRTQVLKKPLTSNRHLKIYLVLEEETIVYVGCTKQSISSRLRYGFSASGNNGYHGYKWRDQYTHVRIFVASFDEPLSGINEQDNAYIAFIEAIEAEIVFIVRLETGKWPQYQHEIHFNNIQPEKAKEIAQKIYHSTKLQSAL
jgi:hypothetical protein